MKPVRFGNAFFVEVHPLVLLPLPVLLLINDPASLGVMLLCALIHEAGHLAAALVQKRRVCGVRLHPAGVELVIESGVTSYLSDVVLHLAGPGADLAAALCTLFLIRVTHALGGLLFLSFYFDLFLFFLQLLPVSGLDGGHALYALLCLHTDPERAFFLCRRVSLCTLAAATALILILLVKSGFHLSLCMTLVFLLLFFWQEAAHEKSPRKLRGP